MTIDERSRHVLHQRLEQVLGADEAGTLMEHLPPVGWADVATKRDLDAMEKYLLGTFRSELAQAISSQTRTLVLTNIGAVLGTAALTLAAIRL
ncbi:MAG: hypothetical protein WEC34_15195 [Acidimicrobiia bacterium]